MYMQEPIDITAGMFTTDVPEDDTYAAWSGATAYVTGDIVYVAATGLRYKAVENSTGVDPTTDTGTYWSDFGSATRWRPFDDYISRVATRSTSLYYEFTPQDFCDSVALFNLGGGTVRVEVINTAPATIYDQTSTLIDTSAIRNWTDFLTFQPRPLKSKLVTGLRAFAGYTLRLTFDVGAGSTAQVGKIMLGRLVKLGNATPGTGLGGVDYSTIETNVAGEREIQIRDYSRTATYVFQVAKGTEDRVFEAIAARRGQLTVFATGDGQERLGTLNIGIPKMPQVALDRGPISIVTVEVEGAS